MDLVYMFNTNNFSWLVAQSLVKLGTTPEVSETIVPTGAGNLKITKLVKGGVRRRQKEF